MLKDQAGLTFHLNSIVQTLLERRKLALLGFIKPRQEGRAIPRLRLLHERLRHLDFISCTVKERTMPDIGNRLLSLGARFGRQQNADDGDKPACGQTGARTEWSVMIFDFQWNILPYDFIPRIPDGCGRRMASS